MHISAEGKIGIGLGLVGLLGAGILAVAPAPWVTIAGWAMIAIAAIGILLLAAHHITGYVRKRRAKNRKAKDEPSKEELYDLYEQIEELKKS